MPSAGPACFRFVIWIQQKSWIWRGAKGTGVTDVDQLFPVRLYKGSIYDYLCKFSNHYNLPRDGVNRAQLSFLNCLSPAHFPTQPNATLLPVHLGCRSSRMHLISLVPIGRCTIYQVNSNSRVTSQRTQQWALALKQWQNRLKKIERHNSAYIVLPIEGDQVWEVSREVSTIKT